jgi:hypothetical protein
MFNFWILLCARRTKKEERSTCIPGSQRVYTPPYNTCAKVNQASPLSQTSTVTFKLIRAKANIERDLRIIDVQIQRGLTVDVTIGLALVMTGMWICISTMIHRL